LGLGDVKVCVLRVGGTNCDRETRRAFQDLGVKADVVHLIQLLRQRNINTYHGLVIPGGFSYGDYVRAGAIWGNEIAVKLGPDLKRFMDEGKPILGICNGFQVLVEAGLLPGLKTSDLSPQAALAMNTSGKYECRWVYLRHENAGRCVFTSLIARSKVLRMPVAHAEGRFIFQKEKEHEYLRALCEGDQLVFRYCDESGEPAEGCYPVNPNGAFHDIAGVCDATGTVFGLMPHPERAYYGWQLPDWTLTGKTSEYADGKLVFESAVKYIVKRF